MSKTKDEWLTHSEQHAWRSYLYATRHLNARLDNELQSIGLLLPEYELLSMLSQSPDNTQRLGVLADMIVQDRSRVSYTVIRLENRSLVTRTTVHGDRRGVQVTLTPHGAQTLRRARAVHLQGVREHFINQIDPGDLTILAHAMDQTHHHLTSTETGLP